MRNIPFLFLLTLLLCPAVPAVAQQDAPERTYETMVAALEPTEIVTYLQIDGRELGLHIFRPPHTPNDAALPVYVVFHGGGWVNFDAQRFYPYANSLTEHGFVGISVDYRLASRNQREEGATTVFDCVRDARAAVRYIRAHADELGIDPNRIAVGGGSAGAHLALATALLDGIDHPDQDLAVSCRPDALVVLFGVIDTSPDGYGNGFIGEDWQQLSPRHHIAQGMPPTILFQGDHDRVAPMPVLEDFCQRLEDNHVPYELVLEEGGVHGHLNSDMALFDDAAQRTLHFLNDVAFNTDPLPEQHTTESE